MEWTFKEKTIFIIFGASIVAAVVLGIKYLFPIFAPFVIAYLIAGILNRPASYLQQKLGGKKSVYGAVMLVVSVSIIMGIAAIVGYMGVKELKSLVSNWEHNMVFVKQNVARISFDVDKTFGLNDGSCLSFLETCGRQVENMFKSGDTSKVVSGVISVSVPVVGKVTTFFASALVCFISVLFILPNIEKVKVWKRKSVFRREIRVVDKSLSLLVKVYFKVEGLIILTNATIVSIGLMIIKNPYAIVLGAIIGLIDMMPVLGTGTVLLPWSIIALIMKRPWECIILLVAYVITYFVREIMEAKLMGKKLGISSLVMLVVIFAGLYVYGFWGFVLGPVTFCIIKPLILYLKRMIESGKLNNI